MEYSKLIRERFSVRKFSPKPVEDEKISEILEAAKVAPTAKNNQPEVIYVLKSKEAIEKINSVCKCIYGAPLVFIVCFDIDKTFHSSLTPGYNFGDVDASIVCTHMMLEAADIGLGSCWVGLFGREEIQKTFDLPENIIPCAILPVGYADADCEIAPRHTIFRDMSEIVKVL